MSDRYYVTEIEGYPISPSFTTAGNARLGLSCHVGDRFDVGRVVASFRSEEYKGYSASIRFAKTRRAASDHAAKLNG